MPDLQGDHAREKALSTLRVDKSDQTSDFQGKAKGRFRLVDVCQTSRPRKGKVYLESSLKRNERENGNNKCNLY